MSTVWGSWMIFANLHPQVATLVGQTVTLTICGPEGERIRKGPVYNSVWLVRFLMEWSLPN